MEPVKHLKKLRLLVLNSLKQSVNSLLNAKTGLTVRVFQIFVSIFYCCCVFCLNYDLQIPRKVPNVPSFVTCGFIASRSFFLPLLLEGRNFRGVATLEKIKRVPYMGRSIFQFLEGRKG